MSKIGYSQAAQGKREAQAIRRYAPAPQPSSPWLYAILTAAALGIAVALILF